MSGTARVWTVEKGEYSDHRVLCVCRTRKRAEAVIAAYNAEAGGYDRVFLGELPIVTEARKVTTYTLLCEVWDDGTTGTTTESTRTEFDFDMLWHDRAVPVGWRWVRAPVHQNKGGRLEVYGTDLEAVRRTFSDRRAQLLAEDAFRARREVRS